MTTVTTIQGDTWDKLAKRIYGKETLMNVLIQANYHNRKIAIFPAGVVLNVPEVDTTSAEVSANLPPWKRGGDE